MNFNFLNKTIRNNFSLVFLALMLILFSTVFVSAQDPSPTSTPAASKKPDAKQMLAEILEAIEKDDKDTIINNLAAGFPAELSDNNGNTLLMQAAKGGKTNALAALLAGGADPNKTAKNGATALLLAVNGNHTDVIKVLVKMGANLNVKDAKGFTPIEFAFLNRRQTALETLRAIQRQVDTDSMFVVQESLIAALDKKDAGKTLRALALGLDPNKGVDEDGGTTPLETAINNNFDTGVSLLIFAGADVNKMTSAGFPVWWLAMSDAQAAGFDVNILKLLIKSGADLKLNAQGGVTPLAFANSQKNPQFAEILTQAGAK